MRTFSKIAAISFVMLFTVLGTAHAETKGLAQSFNWQSVEGSWAVSWGTIPDQKIIADRHTIKKSINDTVSPSLCGIGYTDFDAIKTYAVDFSGDGYLDYVLDETAYFNRGENVNCPVRICEDVNGDGSLACTIALFRTLGGPTQILTATDESAAAEEEAATETTKSGTTTKGKTTEGKTPPLPNLCPSSPEKNVKCRTNCAATPDICPQLFTYQMEVNMSRPVLSWSFIPVDTYAKFQASRLNVFDQPMYHAPYNGNPVFVATVGKAYCTTEEMTGSKCVKYYQFVRGPVAGKLNTFVDLYNPTPSAGEPENDARIATKLYDRSTSVVDSLWRQNAQGSVMAAETQIAIQIPNFTGAKASESLLCREVTNTSKTSHFMPPRTDTEIESFLAAVTAGRLEGVSQKECGRKYTKWYGTTSCPAMACGETRTIAAERRCQRSSSSYGDCSECASLVDTDLIDGNEPNQCTFTKVCTGPACPPHHSCFPAGTEVTMANGSRKAIEKVKIGDEVLGFSRGEPLAKAHAVKVKDLLITDSSELVWVNALKVSPGHTFLLANGLTAPARALKAGDMLVGLSGEPVVISKVGPVKDHEKVYNFTLADGADGYIAGGVRVMMYPDVAE